jgi:hypothetical protein
MEAPVKPADPEKIRILVLRANAVRSALNEVVSENRDEIIRRARAKLVAQGISIDEADLSAEF